MYYAANTVLTAEQRRQHRIWLGLKDWTDGKVVPGAVKVGTRWQPLKARVVARPNGSFSHWADVIVLESRSYPTMRAAGQVAQRMVNHA